MTKQLEQCLIVEMCGKQVDRKYPAMYPACYTEGKARSISKNKREILLLLVCLRMIKKLHRDFSHFANAQNDKIGEADDKTNKSQYDNTNKLEYQIDNINSTI